VVLRPGWRWLPERAAAAAGPPQPRALSLAALQEHCRNAGLAGFKLPRRAAAVPELPRNTGGKVVKPAVRELLLGGPPHSAL
jgi:non-ribosomal peptide synthetase component E (peptide arylation enzyme)